MNSPKSLKDPHDDESRVLQNLFLRGVILCSKFRYLTYLLANFGMSLRLFQLRKELNGGELAVVGLRREKLWDCAIKKFEGKRVVGLEFGVAWGYSSAYFLDRSRDVQCWYGFDSFQGLPDSWRHYQKGHFSNEGNPPEISDERVRWIKGLIDHSFNYNDARHRPIGHNVFVIFDLDLFEPTFIVMSHVIPTLIPGDLIYFDEPNDIDEGSLMHIFLKLNQEKIRLLAISPCQLVFEVIGKPLSFPSLPSAALGEKNITPH